MVVSGVWRHGGLLTSAAPGGRRPPGGKRANEQSTLATVVHGTWTAAGPGVSPGHGRRAWVAVGCRRGQQAPLKVLSSSWGALIDFSLGARIDQ